MEPSDEFIEDRIRQLIAERGSDITRKEPRTLEYVRAAGLVFGIPVTLWAAYVLITGQMA